MRILHIMYYDKKFTQNIVAFYNHFFQKEHFILVINTPKEKETCFLRYDNLFLRSVNPHKISDNYRLFNFIKEYDLVVLHSLTISTLLQCLLLISKKTKKFVWIEWGKDLYYWKSQSKNFLKRKIYNLINFKFRQQIMAVIAIFPPDIDVYKRTFKDSKAMVFYAPYIGYPDAFKDVTYKAKNKISDTLSNKDTIYIQVGHNGMSTLNHIAVLNSLKHFAEENIKVVLPLSYGGDLDYVNKVELYAKKLFGDKALCLRNFLEPAEYFNIIDKVSICIYNTKRQCGLGNIYHMIFHNVKLFMPQDSVMFRYFNSKGVQVYTFEDIGKMSFKEFTRDVSIQNVMKFNSYIDELTNYERKLALWKNIYDEIEKNYKK